ncbi:MAG: DUF488 domain-containing protein [Spirochaetaceae bacterium]|jgi:uncharacterized protein (DUF488 family)|nr:DUF488 domain-containing protein [Spirochaetaceae bacterium]
MGIMGKIYTIGSSIHTIEEFISLLNKYKINAVADVRSVPYSQHTPQYNREVLIDALKRKSIHYLDFSKEFGARRKENDAYSNNQVDFKKVIGLPDFIKGIERIDTGMAKGYNIALLCTEKNPLDCHRFSLVSKALIDKLDVNVNHILFNGEILGQCDLEKKMLCDFGLENDFFTDYKVRLENAYEKISRKVAYQELEGSYE